MIGILQNLILAQFALVVGLAAATLMLLMMRKSRDEKKRLRSEYYQELLTNEMVELATGPRTFDIYKSLNMDRDIFHDVLLSQMKMVSGDEREYLLKLYDTLGFKQGDMQKCKSLFWEQRLNAVVHLGSLDSPTLAPLFHKMITDSEALVSIAALLSLSKLRHPLNSPGLLHHIPRSILNRSNALYELVANIGIHHGVEPLLAAIRENESPKIANACIRALRHLRSFEATEALTEILFSPGLLPDQSIREIIETLTHLGDPSCAKGARQYLNHETAALRAESALLLMVFQDAQSRREIEELRDDPAVEIRRVFQIYESMQAGDSA